MNDELLGDLYEQRLVVMLETEPQSNKYWQVILDEEQFKKVSNAVSEVFPKGDPTDLKPGYEIKVMTLSEEEYELPDELRSTSAD